MSSLLSLINPKAMNTQPCQHCHHRFSPVFNRENFQNSIATFVKQQSKDALFEQLETICDCDSFESKLQDFAETSIKNLSQILKQNAVVHMQFLAPFYGDNNNQHQKFSKECKDFCSTCNTEAEEQKRQDVEEVEVYLDKLLAEFMKTNTIISIKEELNNKKQNQLDKCQNKLDKKQQRLLSLVLNLERYFLIETHSLNFMKKKVPSTEQPQEISKKFQIRKKKLEKVIKKLFVDWQLELEISKFDPTNEDDSLQDISAEKIYETQMQNLIISPFSDRLHTFLTDIFAELNFSEKMLKDLKEAKKLKRKKIQSANKKTPVQGIYSNLQIGAGSSVQKVLFSSPNKRQKVSKTLQQEAQTQTEFKIPIDEFNFGESDMFEASQQASQSILQKRTFSQNFNILEPQIKCNRGNRISKILQQASQSQINPLLSQKQPSEQILNVDLHLQNGPGGFTDSMQFQSMNTEQIESMQPPSVFKKTTSHIDNLQRASLNIISQKKVCAQDSVISSQYNINSNQCKLTKNTNNFKMIDMRKRPNPQKIQNGLHLNFRASNITTSRVKSNGYMTQQSAIISAKSLNDPQQSMSQKQQSISLLLKEDSKQCVREQNHKNSFLNRIKNRNQNTQQTQGSTQTQGVNLTQGTSVSAATSKIQQQNQEFKCVSNFSIQNGAAIVDDKKLLGLE